MAKNIDLSFLFHNIKKYVLKNSDIQFVTPSKWLADLVYSTGYIKDYPIVISNGVDLSKFKMLNKENVRKELKLPLNRFQILLSSSGFDNPYKGIGYAIEAIKLLKDINPLIIMVGKKDKGISNSLKNIDTFEIGYIEDKEILNKYYSAADIYLNTTIAEVQSIASMESMASGTPVFGFATGGVPEFITQDIDGFLVENKDINRLIEKIRNVFNDAKYLYQMQQNARKKIEEKYSLEIFLRNYIDLYKTIIQKF
jgi:glycosyltransferase involved in cell wall biosynthesis